MKYTKEFIKANVNSITPQQYKEFNRSQKASYNYHKRLKYKGKLISKDLEFTIKRYLKQRKQKITPKTDLKYIFKDEHPQKMLNYYQRSKKYQINHIGFFQSIKTVAEKINNGAKFKVTDENGERYYGEKAKQHLIEWEAEKQSQGLNLAKHNLLETYADGKLFFEIDLKNSEAWDSTNPFADNEEIEDNFTDQTDIPF